MSLFDGTAEAIKGFREEQGLTLQATAAGAGVPEEVWQSWEQGTIPEVEHWPRILKVLRCTGTEVWLRKVEIEAAHYQRPFPPDPTLQIPAGLPARLARIQALDVEGLDPAQRQLIESFQKLAGDAETMVSESIAIMQGIVKGEEVH